MLPEPWQWTAMVSVTSGEQGVRPPPDALFAERGPVPCGGTSDQRVGQDMMTSRWTEHDPEGGAPEGGAALSRSVELACTRSRHLVDESTRLLRHSHELRLASRPLACYARVEAVVDGAPTSAVVRRDGAAVVDLALRRRLDLLGSLGETLDTGRPARVGDDPLTSVLTILRACDLVRSVRFTDPARARAAHLPAVEPS